MAYYFYLDDIMLPVAPAKCSLKIKNKNKTINLINEGEVNLIKTAGLTEISFDMRLPATERPYASYAESFNANIISYASKTILGEDLTFKNPSDYISALEKLKTSNEPFTFIVTRMSPDYEMLFDYNMLVTLESYSIEEDAKDGFDVTIPIRLKQYRDYSTKEVEVKTDENGNQTVSVKQNRTTTKSMEKAYKIQREKSVWEACKRASGGSLNWRAVMNLNNISNPTQIPTQGTSIRLETTTVNSSKELTSAAKGVSTVG